MSDLLCVKVEEFDFEEVIVDEKKTIKQTYLVYFSDNSIPPERHDACDIPTYHIMVYWTDVTKAVDEHHLRETEGQCSSFYESNESFLHREADERRRVLKAMGHELECGFDEESDVEDSGVCSNTGSIVDGMSCLDGLDMSDWFVMDDPVCENTFESRKRVANKESSPISKKARQ